MRAAWVPKDEPLEHPAGDAYPTIQALVCNDGLKEIQEEHQVQDTVPCLQLVLIAVEAIYEFALTCPG